MNPRITAAIALMTCIVCHASAARAHGSGEPPAAITPLLDWQGELVGVGANYGVLVLDGEQALWTPDEAVDAEILDWRLLPSGRVIAATPGGPRYSDDGGCTWLTPSEVPRTASAQQLAAGADGTLFLAVESPLGGGIWRSMDEGATWQEAGLASASLLMQRVLVVEDLVVASGFDRADRQQHVWRLEQDARSWQRVASGERCHVVGRGQEMALIACREGVGEPWLLGALRREGEPEQIKMSSELSFPEEAVERDDGVVWWRDVDATLYQGGAVEQGRAGCLRRGPDGALWRCLETLDPEDAHLARLSAGRRCGSLPCRGKVWCRAHALSGAPGRCRARCTGRAISASGSGCPQHLPSTRALTKARAHVRAWGRGHDREA